VRSDPTSVTASSSPRSGEAIIGAPPGANQGVDSAVVHQ
jgi:hypothetical protein